MAFLRATLLALGVVVVLAAGLASLGVTGPKTVLIEIVPAYLIAWFYLRHQRRGEHDSVDG